MTSLKVNNVFELVHHFGNEEDQLSASFGSILANDKQILSRFLKKIGLDPSKEQIKKTVIETQGIYQYYKRGKRKKVTRKIDLVIGCSETFLVFIESKIWGNQFSEDQLESYWKILYDKRLSFKSLKLVLITQSDQFRNFRKFVKNRRLKKDEVYYFKWQDLIKLIKKTKTANRFFNKLFLQYLGQKMYDIKSIPEQKVGETVEVLVITTKPDWWEVIKKDYGKGRFVIHYLNSSDAQYVAIYRTAPKKAITHVAKVKETRLVNAKEWCKGTPLEKRAIKEGWQSSKIFILEKPLKLKKPIPYGRWAHQSKWESTFAKLLNANSTWDTK